MIKVTPDSCCGCTACATICPHDAISMSPDALGFLYPIVHMEKCVECGLCEKVCPFDQPFLDSYSVPMDAFAVRHKEQQEIDKSRSGAFFAAISDHVLQKGGVVYGAGYSEHFRVVHKRAITKDERDEFRGSKYVQSDMDSIFKKVREDLKKGLLVLFSGTPCQIAGLSSYLGKMKDCENLLLVDIVCHGVASPSVWRDYIAFLQKKENDSLSTLSFRDKSIYGWSGLHKESFTFKNKGKKTYQYTFYSDILIRQACNKCPFTSLKRMSDLTLGDFWGVEQIIPGFNKNDTGVSVVLRNTQKGKKVFEAVKDSIIALPVGLDECMQPNLQYPTPANSKRMSFEEDYKDKGFIYIMHKYGEVGAKYHFKRICRFIKRHVYKISK